MVEWFPSINRRAIAEAAMRYRPDSARTASLPVAFTLLACLLGLTAACGSKDNPAGPGSGGGAEAGGGGSSGGGTGSFGMRATVDGVPWTGEINVAAIATGNALVVTGVSDIGTPNQILITVNTPARVGTETVTFGPGSQVGGLYVTSPTTGWSTISPLGSGAVTVTSLTATRATGTFSFVMAPNTGAPAPLKTVSNGSFDARIPTP
jgi:hypothetical protein